MTLIQDPSLKKRNLYLFNLGVFIAYFLIGSLISTYVRGSFGGWIVLFGYLIHSVVLIFISLVEVFRGRIQKIKTRAGDYFLCAILLLLIGFGTCSMAFKFDLVPFLFG